MIEEGGILSHFLSHKPEFAPGGIELECPDCKQKATYQRSGLSYQA
jgi:hypothetical protein